MAGAEGEPERMQMHQPRLAELIAGILRQRIVTGQLPEGASLPKQEDLLTEFNVSKPSIREALRILEAEGMIRVRKGNVGGAVVRLPKPANVAHMLGLVLQSQSVPMQDLAAGIGHLEPVCSALCAQRPDRATTVVPVLQDLNDRSLALLDDEIELTRVTRQFHEQLVALCGNQTLILVVGALESLWSSQEHDWAERAAGDGEFPAVASRRTMVDAHVDLVGLIAAGDVEATWQAATRHLEERLYPGGSGGQAVVDATHLHPPA